MYDGENEQAGDEDFLSAGEAKCDLRGTNSMSRYEKLHHQLGTGYSRWRLDGCQQDSAASAVS